MSSEIICEINIDFQDSKYIQVNAKQFDRDSRYVLISCYNKKTFFPLNGLENYAYIRYRKADDYGVFNSCKITDDGKVLVELTEQMLSVAGKSYGDLVIVHNDQTINSGSVASSMIFCVNVICDAFDNSQIESSYEFNALNELLIKATNTYDYLVITCQNYANIAKENGENAISAANEARESEVVAIESANLAKESENNAVNAANEARESAAELSGYIDSCAENATIAIEKAEASSSAALLSKSYAVGETEIRTGEDTDNAKYYYYLMKTIKEGLTGAFLPQGSIYFSELSTVEKDVGYLYHIKDEFNTDSTFREGSGYSHPAGTNVYYTANGYWDCLIDRNLVMIDDNMGNVTLEYCYDSITSNTLYNTLNQVVAQLRIDTSELDNRITELENTPVIGVNE